MLNICVLGDIWGNGVSIFFTSLFNMLQIVQGTYKISICNYDIFFHGLHLGTWALWCFLKWINSDNGYIQLQCFALCKKCSRDIEEDEENDDINIHVHPPPPYEA